MFLALVGAILAQALLARLHDRQLGAGNSQGRRRSNGPIANRRD
jgi:hypothetical protein